MEVLIWADLISVLQKQRRDSRKQLLQRHIQQRSL
eukprot:XP_001708924.1 Hypothetical protein GL50803_7694 [Giardia lamblia ATCC 50803]